MESSPELLVLQREQIRLLREMAASLKRMEAKQGNVLTGLEEALVLPECSPVASVTSIAGPASPTYDHVHDVVATGPVPHPQGDED
eukprot:CAMPEP_0180792220 /NCGR_PEP_ID=MMETSP1038_2-20121128/54277_1 /TAXON_ID=632150 /ORGANISM="Azadinium spinosum, Strain 3D9" /LENGTH=85 /DNA_ID=CAMNT_0022830513 /DNA_START=18 /DNA_END=272 /DNA_ORIENTATION=-